MTDLRSVITIDVQADTFAEFQAAFEKYRNALNAMPEQWRKVMEGAQKASTASTSNIKKTADQVDKARQNAKKTDDEFNRLNKTTGSIKNNIGDSTRMLERWAGLGLSIGLLSSAFGGMKDLALGVTEQRKQARGLGVKADELTALQSTISRFIDVEGDLEKINAARYDLSKRYAFGAVGIKDFEKKSNLQILMDLIQKQKEIVKQPGFTLDLARARGFGVLGSEQDLLQLRGTGKQKDVEENVKRLDELIGEYQKLRDQAPDTEKAGKAAEDFTTALQEAGNKVRNFVLTQLEPFFTKIAEFIKTLDPMQATLIGLGLGLSGLAVGVAALRTSLGLLLPKGAVPPAAAPAAAAAESAATRTATSAAAGAGATAASTSFFSQMGKFLFAGARLGSLASGLLYSPEAGKADEAAFIGEEREKQKKAKRAEAKAQGLKESTAPPSPDIDLYKRSLEGAPPELSKEEKAAILKGQILYPGQPETTKPVPLPQTVQPISADKKEDQRKIEDRQAQIERDLKEKPKDEASKRAKEMELFAVLEKQNNLLPGMLDEIYKIESSRGKQLYNIESKAAGPFQIIPKTAKSYGLSKEETYDLPKSAKVAADMFNQLMTKYKGDLDKVLAGYNYGQGKLDKLLESGKTLQDLPKETKEYIKTFREEMHLPPSSALEPPASRAEPQPTQGMNQQFNPTINVRVSAPAGTSVEVNTAQMANFA